MVSGYTMVNLTAHVGWRTDIAILLLRPVLFEQAVLW